MYPVFKADAPGFIWLIVGIFWVVAQIAGAAAKKNQSARSIDSGDDEPATPPVDPFAELLRRVAGTQTFEVPQPEYEEEQEEALARTETMPDIEPLRREPMGQEEPKPVPAAVAGINIRPTMRAFRNTLPAMKLPAMTLRFQPLEKQTGKVPMLGKIVAPSDKPSMRRAMLGHIIFSKPKALE
ncbi:MAG: hypothetical protein WC047_04135 [Kiritimatiellales bacterium]